MTILLQQLRSFLLSDRRYALCLLIVYVIWAVLEDKWVDQDFVSLRWLVVEILRRHVCDRGQRRLVSAVGGGISISHVRRLPLNAACKGIMVGGVGLLPAHSGGQGWCYGGVRFVPFHVPVPRRVRRPAKQ